MKKYQKQQNKLMPIMKNFLIHRTKRPKLHMPQTLDTNTCF